MLTQKINSSVIFFHGLKDNVVDIEQVYKIFKKLESNKIPVELYTFPNEGHGFKNVIVNTQVLQLTEKFFTKNLGICL